MQEMLRTPKSRVDHKGQKKFGSIPPYMSCGMLNNILCFVDSQFLISKFCGSTKFSDGNFVDPQNFRV